MSTLTQALSKTELVFFTELLTTYSQHNLSLNSTAPILVHTLSCSCMSLRFIEQKERQTLDHRWTSENWVFLSLIFDRSPKTPEKFKLAEVNFSWSMNTKFFMNIDKYLFPHKKTVCESFQISLWTPDYKFKFDHIFVYLSFAW